MTDLSPASEIKSRVRWMRALRLLQVWVFLGVFGFLYEWLTDQNWALAGRRTINQGAALLIAWFV